MKLSIIKKLKTKSYQEQKETEIFSYRITFRILLSSFTVCLERANAKAYQTCWWVIFVQQAWKVQQQQKIGARLLTSNSGRVCLVGVKINLILFFENSFADCSVLFTDHWQLLKG